MHCVPLPVLFLTKLTFPKSPCLHAMFSSPSGSWQIFVLLTLSNP